MKRNFRLKSITALLLTVCMLAALFAGCKGRDETSESEAPSQSESSKAASTGEKVSAKTPDFIENVEEMYKLNDDTVGWLEVPGLDINDVVVQKKDDLTNKYYMRLNFEEEWNFNGIFYADYRAEFGTREEMGTATTIYGHSIVDNHDRDDDRYAIKFGPLHDFREPELAKKMPYINFSTEKENMVFEVMAVFIGNADNPDLPYNDNPEPKEYLELIEKEILPRSIYNYEAAENLTEDDKFLLLSTCLYYLQDGTDLGYPNWYRYVVMGKLISPDEEWKEEAVFTENEDMVIDPPGRIATKK